jgi:hypothetical protein
MHRECAHCHQPIAGIPLYRLGIAIHPACRTGFDPTKRIAVAEVQSTHAPSPKPDAFKDRFWLTAKEKQMARRWRAISEGDPDAPPVPPRKAIAESIRDNLKSEEYVFDIHHPDPGVRRKVRDRVRKRIPVARDVENFRPVPGFEGLYAAADGRLERRYTHQSSQKLCRAVIFGRPHDRNEVSLKIGQTLKSFRRETLVALAWPELATAKGGAA